MRTDGARALLRRLGHFLDGFSGCFSRRPRVEAASRYLDGLLNDSERKSIRAMHGRLSDPASYRALQHFITHSPWDAKRVWRQLRAAVPARAGILALDDTGFPKQGTRRRRATPVLRGAREDRELSGGGLECAPCRRSRVIARATPEADWQTVTWGPPMALLTGTFFATRVRAATGRGPRWLLCERLANQDFTFDVLNLAADAPLVALVTLARSRWPIEQQYRALKDDLGLDHFEGRSDRGWQHHVVLTAVAFTFLHLERPTLPIVRGWVREIFGLLYVIHSRRLLAMLDSFVGIHRYEGDKEVVLGAPAGFAAFVDTSYFSVLASHFQLLRGFSLLTFFLTPSPEVPAARAPRGRRSTETRR